MRQSMQNIYEQLQSEFETIDKAACAIIAYVYEVREGGRYIFTCKSSIAISLGETLVCTPIY